MARRTVRSNRRPPQTQSARYSQRSLLHDRQYGFYWYAWLWKMLRPMLILTISLIVVLGIVTTGWNYVYGHFFMPVNPDDTQVREFVIESGTSITKIGDNLYDQGYIRNKGVFKYAVQFQELTNKIQYGSYPLSSSMDINEVIAILAQGSGGHERQITIIPGWTIDDLARDLLERGAITDTNAFKALCNQTDQFIPVFGHLETVKNQGGLKGRKYALEGYLAPDTYRVYTNAEPDAILQKLLRQSETVYNTVFNEAPIFETVVDEQGNQLDEEGNIIAEEQELFETTLTMDQTIILASMIEKEAGKKADFAKVSAVFHNRLLRGMKLESDACVAYAVGADRLVLTSAELKTDSPYNTYLYEGLPVGPICNPSRDALQAALYPDMDYVYEEYLYFCATDPAKGDSYFSKTQEEHQAAVRQYRPLWVEYDKSQGG